MPGLTCTIYTHEHYQRMNFATSIAETARLNRPRIVYGDFSLYIVFVVVYIIYKCMYSVTGH